MAHTPAAAPSAATASEPRCDGLVGSCGRTQDWLVDLHAAHFETAAWGTFFFTRPNGSAPDAPPLTCCTQCCRTIGQHPRDREGSDDALFGCLRVFWWAGCDARNPQWPNGKFLLTVAIAVASAAAWWLFAGAVGVHANALWDFTRIVSGALALVIWACAAWAFPVIQRCGQWTASTARWICRSIAGARFRR